MKQKTNKIIIGALLLVLILVVIGFASKYFLTSASPNTSGQNAVLTGNQAASDENSSNYDDNHSADHQFRAVPTSTISFSKTAEWTLNDKTMNLLVASTSAEQELGLGQRPSLASTTGMIFVFDAPGSYPFWMKDMSFPLDIIWLDQNFKIIHIEKNLSPSTFPNAYTSDSPAQYVIEVNAGFTGQNSLSVGDALDIR